jgi:hypothetical protein
MTAAMVRRPDWTLERTTRPLHFTRISFGVPRTAAGMTMLKSISDPIARSVSTWNNTPPADMSLVTASWRMDLSAKMATGNWMGNLTELRSSCTRHLFEWGSNRLFIHPFCSDFLHYRSDVTDGKVWLLMLLGSLKLAIVHCLIIH